MPDNIHISYFKTPVGELILGSYHNKLCMADWRYRKMRDAIDSRLKKGFEADFTLKSSEIIEKTKIQLQEYFNQKRKIFDLDLELVGTDFQKKVWQNLQEIPFGKTFSYLDLSNKMQQPKAIRAVASANGANAISIIIPCHRIIGSNGKLVGYAGGLQAKKKLLQLEGAWMENQLSFF